MQDVNNLRHIYLDSAGGILLVYMIVYHCAQWSGFADSFTMHTMALSFFMPWFFFKGGLCYKPASFSTSVSKGFHRLLVPWICFTLIGAAVFFVIQYTGRSSTPHLSVFKYFKYILVSGTTIGNLALWFLFSLFFVRVIYAWLQPRRYGMVAIVVISSVHFFMFYVVEPNVTPDQWLHIPRYISNISSGMMYYALGHLLGRTQGSWSCERLSTRSTAIVSALYLICVCCFPSHVFLFNNELFTGYYILAPIYYLLGIVSIDNICRIVANKPNIFSRIGRDTMPYYCMHWIVIEAVAAACGLSGMNAFVALVTANIVLLPLLIHIVRKAGLNFIFG